MTSSLSGPGRGGDWVRERDRGGHRHRARRRRNLVAIVARQEPPPRSVAETIEHAGETAHVVVSDVADPKSVIAAAESTRVNLGQPHILVNGAVFADTCRVEGLTMNEVDHTIDLNLKGARYWTKADLRDLLADGGDLVNVASLGGARHFPGWSLYCAAKHGVVGFARALAQEVADRKVRVTGVCPEATAPPVARSRGCPTPNRRR